MNTNELKNMITMIEDSNIDVLKLEKGDFKLFYQKPNTTSLFEEKKNDVSTIEDELKNDNPLNSEDSSANTESEDNLHTIKSPMIGTFYACPNPDEAAYVQVGTTISKADTVCILEAMKLINEVPSDVEGEIVNILVEDGQIIEYGQPLFTVKVAV